MLVTTVMMMLVCEAISEQRALRGTWLTTVRTVQYPASTTGTVQGQDCKQY